MTDILRRVWMRTRSEMPAVPRVVYRMFPQALWVGNPARREIALTYDDGPHPHDTPQLLRVLALHDVVATFCMIGERVEIYPDLIAAIADGGHEIGVHGYRHRPFVLNSSRVLREQLDRTQNVIATAANCDPATIHWVRPPFGLFTPALLRSLVLWGYRPVLGTIIPVHWWLSVEVTVAQVIRSVRPGSLIVLHESHDGPSVAAITDALILRLKAAGYRFVNLDHMWEAKD